MGFMKPQKTEESLMYFKYFATFPLILHKKSESKIAIESSSCFKHITLKPMQPEDYKGLYLPFGILLTNITKLYYDEENKPTNRVMEFSGWEVGRTGRKGGEGDV